MGWSFLMMTTFVEQNFIIGLFCVVLDSKNPNKFIHFFPMKVVKIEEIKINIHSWLSNDFSFNGEWLPSISTTSTFLCWTSFSHGFFKNSISCEQLSPLLYYMYMGWYTQRALWLWVYYKAPICCPISLHWIATKLNLKE